MHCFTAGVGVHGSLVPLSAGVPPPSAAPLFGALFGSGAGAGVAQSVPPMLSQVQLEGQSAAVSHTFGTAWQLEVVTAGHSQVVGGVVGSVGVAEPPSIAGVAPLEPLLEPLDAEPELAHAQPPESWTQVKPAPQSASAVQGTSYFGMHWLCVVGVHAGWAQFSPAAQGGAASHTVCVEV